MKKKSAILFVLLIGLYSCEKELSSIELDKNEIVIHYDESEQLSVSYSPSDVDVPPVFLWETTNNNIAKVDANGMVEGVRVGETSVVVKTVDQNFEDSCKVIIEPISNLYIEPLFEPGQSLSDIKNKETRSLLLEESKRLLFEDENSNVIYVMYLFGTGGLESVTVLLQDEVLDEAKLFLTERYEPYSAKNNVFNFKVNDDVMAGLTYDSRLGLVVMYMENTFDTDADTLSHVFTHQLVQAKK